jgi:cytochrome c-type biogenesis protein CcmF
LATVLATFTVGSIVGLLFEQARTRADKNGEGISSSLRQVIVGDTAFWAGQLSHIGVILVAVGIAFAANLAVHAVVQLQPGDSTEFAGYVVAYESPFQYQEPQRTVVGARLTILRSGSLVAEMEPTANFYGPDSSSGIVTPAVLSRPGGDLYLTLRNIDSESITLSLDTSPLIWLLWFGGFVTAAGGFWALLSRRVDRARSKDAQAADV